MNKYLAHLRRVVDPDDEFGFKYIELIQNALNRFKFKNPYTYKQLKYKYNKKKFFVKNGIRYRYSEAHHIVPRCCNGVDECDNIILLFGTNNEPEHVLAHKFLSKSSSLFLDKKEELDFAYLLMITNNGVFLNEEEASELRRLARLSKRPMSDQQKQKLRAIRLGTHISDETKKKISIATAGENNPMYGRRGVLNPNYGAKRTDETKEKIRQTWSEERRLRQKDNYNKKNKTLIKYNDQIYDVYELAVVLNTDYTTILRNLDEYEVIRKYTRKPKKTTTWILNDEDGELYTARQLEDIEICGAKRSHSTIFRWARNDQNGLHIIN